MVAVKKVRAMDAVEGGNLELQKSILFNVLITVILKKLVCEFYAYIRSSLVGT